MAYRTIIIKNRCKLEYSLNYLVCRGETESKILIDEIEFLIIQDTGVSLTCALLSALVEKKVKVLFCDRKANPQFELTPFYNNYCTYKKITQQMNFSENVKNQIWKKIIERKIYHEYLLLNKLKHPQAEKIKVYLNEVEPGDGTNREGHAAKVYFNAIFGPDFSRNDTTNPINKYLNYGYSIIVSFINREIKLCGYLTELGIHHKGETNSFNLSYDFFEPLRTYIDRYVVEKKVNDENFKDVFMRVLTDQVFLKGKSMFLDNALHYYIQSLFTALIREDTECIDFIEYGI